MRSAYCLRHLVGYRRRSPYRRHISPSEQVCALPALTETKSPAASSCPSSRTSFAVSSLFPALTESSFRDSVSWDQGSSRGASDPGDSPLHAARAAAMSGIAKSRAGTHTGRMRAWRLLVI